MILLAQSVHWFNPLVHMMAYAANRDIEISCDEEVIKNTDAAFRRQYAESMLSVMQKSLHLKTMLSTNFYGGEKVMKQRFTAIFDMKVKKKGIMLFAIVLVATLMAGMLVSCAANPASNEPTGKVAESPAIDISFEADGDIPDAVRNYATDYVQNQIDYYENDCGYLITDAKITALTRQDTDANLGNDIHVWLLEYRLHPKDPDKVMLVGGMKLEDGWITEWSSAGQPFLVLVRHTGDESWERIGVTQTLTVAEDYGGNYSRAAMDMYDKKIEKSSNTSPVIKTGSGSYVGQADNNSIEIKLNYTNGPGPVFRVFKISDEVRPTFESLSLKTDDEIKFSYYEQVIGQPVLTKIEKIRGGLP